MAAIIISKLDIIDDIKLEILAHLGCKKCSVCGIYSYLKTVFDKQVCCNCKHWYIDEYGDKKMRIHGPNLIWIPFGKSTYN